MHTLLRLSIIVPPCIYSSNPGIVLPVFRCDDQLPCVEITYENTTTRAIITLNNDLVLNSLIFLDNDSLPVNISETYNFPVRFRPTETPISIGLGPSSPVLIQHGSIALIRGQETDSLHLGISEYDFNASCIPDSMIELSLWDSEWVVDGTVDLVSPEYGIIPTLFEPLNANIFEHKNGFPVEVVQPIIDHLRFHGAVGTTTFTNCSLAMIESAPLIRLALGERSDQTIFLYPDDYIDFDPRSNSCTLLFRRFHSLSMWEFAPFTIPQTNVFVTNHSLYICDSEL
jgi:hypothetical protein